MDAPTSYPSPLPGNVDTVNASTHRHDDPPQSPDRLPVTVVAQRRIMNTGAVGSPVCRSPRLSGLLPPQPLIESHDTQDEGSDDESESVNDISLHLPHDETPEDDDLPPDEPSTILANRIIRAHDNPSPPPQDLAHPDINSMPGKDGQFALSSVFVPPSPFRPINLLERLNQLSDPSFDPPHSPRTPSLGVKLDVSGPAFIPSRGLISSESSSPFITSMPMKSTPHEDLASANAIPSSSTRHTVDDLPSRSSQHSITVTSSMQPEILNSLTTQAIDSSFNSVVPPGSDDFPRRPFPHPERRQSVGECSPIPTYAKTSSSPPSDKNGKISPDTETIDPDEQGNNGEEILSVNDTLPSSKGKQASKYEATSTKQFGDNSFRRLDSLSPRSSNVLFLAPELTSILPAETTRTKCSPATPPRTPVPSLPHPDFSRTSVQRPAIAPMPLRANSARKLDSSAKFSPEVDDIFRTPAQRVPIKSALSHETSSFQRTIQLSTVSGQSLPGRLLTTKAPVFTRPALDDPSRSPAKRIPITDLVASPTKGHQTQSLPMRLGLRTRSASVEPRPLEVNLARGRSVEPCVIISKPDNHEKIKESIFPMVPIFPRTGIRLPFPLIPGQTLSSNSPPSIPEEHKNAVIGHTETNPTLHRVTQSNTMAQLRQPSTSSRIPRIGNKPYARSPKNRKATASTTIANTGCTSRASPFQLVGKNSRDGNTSAQPTNDQCLVGSLKRKRGTEVAAPPNSRPVMIRQVVPGILSGKYAPKPVKPPSRVHAPPDSSPPKLPQPIKFRKVVDGMLSARYAPAKANLPQTETSDSASLPPSPLSELSSSSNEGSSDEKLVSTSRPSTCPKSEILDTSRANVNAFVMEPGTHEHSSLHQDADGDKSSSRLRRTSRNRKPAQQQYVLDVFNGNTSTRPPPARRKPQSRTEGDCFMGMSATALKALTTSNTTKNQQSVAVLATEVVRKDGLRPESPMIKARTILQKQRDERDMRRRERAERKAQMNEGLGSGDTEGRSELDDRVFLNTHAGHDENDGAIPQHHLRGPGDEEDYETPERSDRVIEPLRLEGMDGKVRSMKQVKWHRGLSTAVYLDEVGPKLKSLPKNVVVRSCLAPTSKNLPLDSLGNLVDVDNRPFPEPVTEHIIVKRYLYDNDVEPEPIPEKVTRSKSKKRKS